MDFCDLPQAQRQHNIPQHGYGGVCALSGLVTDTRMDHTRRGRWCEIIPEKWGIPERLGDGAREIIPEGWRYPMSWGSAEREGTDWEVQLSVPELVFICHVSHCAVASRPSHQERHSSLPVCLPVCAYLAAVAWLHSLGYFHFDRWARRSSSLPGCLAIYLVASQPAPFFQLTWSPPAWRPLYIGQLSLALV